MNSKLRRLLKGEGGITGLETAIILIAFVVVAAVFAFTVLSAGIFSSEKGKEAVYSGLEQVSGSVEIRSSVVAKGDTANDKVTYLVFSIANAASGEPLDLTTPDSTDMSCVVASGCVYTGTDHVLVIDYRDEDQVVADLPWTVVWRGRNDGDADLEEGEVAEITVALNDSTLYSELTSNDVLTPTLGVDTAFQLDIKPPQGGTIIMGRTTPSNIDAVMDLK